MYICFVEYRIEEQALETYRTFMKQQVQTCQGLHIYEGTDQPGLFVEQWHAASEQEAQRIKEERCSAHSSFAAVNDWVPGGAAKVHAWVFKPL
jgi:hypothetical protein